MQDILAFLFFIAAFCGAGYFIYWRRKNRKAEKPPAPHPVEPPVTKGE